MNNFENRFKITPILENRRSRFNMSKKHLTTFNTGDLVPIYSKMIYPGDTITLKTDYVVRTTTPIKAPFDIAYLDIYYFFVPMRLVWDHTKEFFGENKLTAWEQPTEYEIPQIKAPTGGWEKGTIAEQMGIPIKKEITVNSLKFRAYALIWQEWFRDQNLQEGTMINLDEQTLTGSNGTDMASDLQLGGKMAKVNKFHDYFTSCLPTPQKGPEIMLPLGNTAPIITSKTENSIINFEAPLTMVDRNGQKETRRKVLMISSDNADGILRTGPDTEIGTGGSDLFPNNLVADLSLATASTIANVRQAFAIQQLYEAFARGGTRYREIIKNTFGVSSSDARMQIPEYLGGKRTPMNIEEVVQTSESTSTSPQGNIAGFGKTINTDEGFTKSFDEHGYVIGLACVRTNHTYQQGIKREDFLKSKLEMFWPQFEGIGEQAVLNKEIYADGSEKDEEVFGYQERYAELKTDFNTVAGEFRSDTDNSLDVWHYADDYESRPTLSPNWIEEDKTNMDRTLQVTSSLADQIQADFYFNVTMTRVMQMFSIPGLTRM